MMSANGTLSVSVALLATRGFSSRRRAIEHDARGLRVKLWPLGGCCTIGAPGIATFEIARMMGSSVVQIEETYGHLLPGAIARGRAALDGFDIAGFGASGAEWAQPTEARATSAYAKTSAFPATSS
jgi:hypothetical protein